MKRYTASSLKEVEKGPLVTYTDLLKVLQMATNRHDITIDKMVVKHSQEMSDLLAELKASNAKVMIYSWSIAVILIIGVILL